MLQLLPVDSSSIAALGYVPLRRELIVKFRERDVVYAYEGVAEFEFRALLAADSKGRFINLWIKPRHRFRRLSI